MLRHARAGSSAPRGAPPRHEDFSERFGAVDGAELDFATVPEDVLTAAGRHQAEHPPEAWHWKNHVDGSRDRAGRRTEQVV